MVAPWAGRRLEEGEYHSSISHASHPSRLHVNTFLSGLSHCYFEFLSHMAETKPNWNNPQRKPSSLRSLDPMVKENLFSSSICVTHSLYPTSLPLVPNSGDTQPFAFFDSVPRLSDKCLRKFYRLSSCHICLRNVEICNKCSSRFSFHNCPLW